MKSLRNLILAALLLLATVTPAAAAPDDPQDNGFGMAYDALIFEPLAYSPPIDGQTQAVVTQVRWSDGRYVEPDAGAVILIARWPRAENDTARALDSVGWARTEQRGLAIVPYAVPNGVLLPGEQAVTATLELSALAFRVGTWPQAGFAKREMTVTVGRNE